MLKAAVGDVPIPDIEIGKYAFHPFRRAMLLVFMTFLTRPRLLTLYGVGIDLLNGEVKSSVHAAKYADDVVVPNKTVEVRYWKGDTASGSLKFPEIADDEDYCIPALKHKANFAICLSGGGMRAAVSSLGWMRMLFKLGYLEKAKYVCCTSGWYLQTLFLLVKFQCRITHSHAVHECRVHAVHEWCSIHPQIKMQVISVCMCCWGSMFASLAVWHARLLICKGHCNKPACPI